MMIGHSQEAEPEHGPEVGRTSDGAEAEKEEQEGRGECQADAVDHDQEAVLDV